MRQMVVRGWHISPAPTEIDFIKVVTPPVTRTLPNKDRYMGGVIECVINETKISVPLTAAGRSRGTYRRAVDRRPMAVTLVQDRLHTQFYIDLWQQLTPPGDGITRGSAESGTGDEADRSYCPSGFIPGRRNIDFAKLRQMIRWDGGRLWRIREHRSDRRRRRRLRRLTHPTHLQSANRPKGRHERHRLHVQTR